MWGRPRCRARLADVPDAASPCTDAAAQPASSGDASANGSAAVAPSGFHAVATQQTRHARRDGGQDLG